LTWCTIGSGSDDTILGVLMLFRFTTGLLLLLRDDDFDEEAFVVKV